jgi:hypothetical protein
MKALRIAALAALAVLYAAGVHAQSNDPVIRTGGGTHSVAVTSPIFRVVSPSGNSPALSTVPNSTDCVLYQPGQTSTAVPGCFFKNEIVLPGGADLIITRLIFVVDNADFTGVLTCGTDTTLGGTGPFSACSVQPILNGAFSVVTFSNGSVPFGSDFSLGMRGFNANIRFAVLALGSTNSGTAEIYELPDLARPNSAHRAVNDAPRFLGCETCQLQTLAGLQRDRRSFVSGSIAADTGKTVQSSAWRSSSTRPNSDGMPGPSPITFEAWLTSGCVWRIT